MKLELEHLAPYLPFKVLVGDGRTPFELTEYNFTNIFKYIDRIYLRPLSDLTNEIEVNGEKFVPIIELAKLFHICKSAVTHFSNIQNAGFYGISVNCHIENDDGRFTYYQIRNEEFVLSNTYEEVQKLLEWHFDVFGLIEQGLAIDINTIKI